MGHVVFPIKHNDALTAFLIPTPGRVFTSYDSKCKTFARIKITGHQCVGQAMCNPVVEQIISESLSWDTRL